MDGFSVHHLRFTLQAVDHIELPRQGGVALRGALYAALSRHYCPAGGGGDPTHSALCPVCKLLATEEPAAQRGRNIPRPLTIEPPLDGQGCYEPGQQFSFGLGIVGSTVGLFPYLALAVPMMAHKGMGRRLDRNGGARGRFMLQGIEAINPLNDDRQTLMNEANEIIALPAVPATWEQALCVAETLPTTQLKLNFLTTTRIVDRKKLVHQPLFRPLFQRLIERLISLSETFGSGRPDVDARALVDAAGEVQLVEDKTRWLDLHSGSRRLGRATPIGGYVGQATYEGDMTLFLPWLLIGQSAHVGKSTTKGNGWYELIR
jgi:hypothetical protein